MSVATVTLTDSGATGLIPLGYKNVSALAAMPTTVKLGAVLRPPSLKSKVPKLEHFIDAMKSTPPDRSKYSTKAMPSLSRMYMNDQYGCCVISSSYHGIGVWSGNDEASCIVVSDQEIYNAYMKLKAGPGDSGCIITDVLDYHVSQGLMVNGKADKLDGYVAVDWTNKPLAKAALYLLGGGKIGFNLPQAWMNSDTWDLTNSPIVGGHDVYPVDYDETYVYVSSWGRIYRITWPAFMSRSYLTEFYALLSKHWYNDDKLAPNGVNVDALRSAVDSFKNDSMPNWDPIPVPPGPPIPPVPPIPPSPPVPPPPAPLVFPHYVGSIPVRNTFGQVVYYPIDLKPQSSAMAAPVEFNWNDFYSKIHEIKAFLEQLGLDSDKVRELLKIAARDLIARKPVEEIIQDLLAKILGS